MSRFYYPLAPDVQREVWKRVADRIAERHKRNMEVHDTLPGMKAKSGREKLQDYRQTDMAYWTQLFASYPREAVRRFNEWAMLTRRYGGLNEQRPMPVAREVA